MIITPVIGGLGNQLFQYAAARCLAVLNNTDVKLDTTCFQNYQLRNLELNKLNIKAAIATKQEVEALKPKGQLQRIQSYLMPYKKRKFYKQPYFHFDPHFYQLGSNVYLQGYFQSERYFTPILSILRQELRIDERLLENIHSLSSTLKAECSVALHIRRGDYKDEEQLRYHGILSLSYYQQAIAYLKDSLAAPHFYIFTDDSQWVKENLLLENATIISGIISKTHFEDLYLMSQCQHNIIANSSFGWWGAWLNTNPRKIVIAPKQWFNEGPKDTQDLYPSGWITLLILLSCYLA